MTNTTIGTITRDSSGILTIPATTKATFSFNVEPSGKPYMQNNIKLNISPKTTTMSSHSVTISPNVTIYENTSTNALSISSRTTTGAAKAAGSTTYEGWATTSNYFYGEVSSKFPSTGWIASVYAECDVYTPLGSSGVSWNLDADNTSSQVVYIGSTYNGRINIASFAPSPNSTFIFPNGGQVRYKTTSTSSEGAITINAFGALFMRDGVWSYYTEPNVSTTTVIPTGNPYALAVYPMGKTIWHIKRSYYTDQT